MTKEEEMKENKEVVEGKENAVEKWKERGKEGI